MLKSADSNVTGRNRAIPRAWRRGSSWLQTPPSMYPAAASTRYRIRWIADRCSASGRSHRPASTADSLVACTRSVRRPRPTRHERNSSGVAMAGIDPMRFWRAGSCQPGRARRSQLCVAARGFPRTAVRITSASKSHWSSRRAWAIGRFLLQSSGSWQVHAARAEADVREIQQVMTEVEVGAGVAGIAERGKMVLAWPSRPDADRGWWPRWGDAGAGRRCPSEDHVFVSEMVLRVRTLGPLQPVKRHHVGSPTSAVLQPRST